MEAIWESLSLDDDSVELSPGENSSEQLFLAISKSAVSGVPTARTIRFLGTIAGVPVQILVDSGSSSSFISISLAAQLRHEDSILVSSSVQVAGGGVL